MTNLSAVDLEGSDISDIAALVNNAGLGPGDKIILAGNPLSEAAHDTQLPVLQERGVFVGFVDDHGDRTATATRLAPGATVAGLADGVDYTITVQAVNAVGFGPIGTFAAPPDEIAADAPPPPSGAAGA